MFKARFYSPKTKQRYTDDEIKAIMFLFGAPFPHTIDSIKIEFSKETLTEVRIYAIGTNLKWKE